MRTKSRKEAIGLKDVIQLPDTWKLYSERRKKINGVTYVSERYIQKRGRGNLYSGVVCRSRRGRGARTSTYRIAGSPYLLIRHFGQIVRRSIVEHKNIRDRREAAAIAKRMMKWFDSVRRK